MLGGVEASFASLALAPILPTLTRTGGPLTMLPEPSALRRMGAAPALTRDCDGFAPAIVPPSDPEPLLPTADADADAADADADVVPNDPFRAAVLAVLAVLAVQLAVPAVLAVLARPFGLIDRPASREDRLLWWMAPVLVR